MSHSVGELVARALRGSWRSELPPLELTLEEAARLVPRFVKTGSAGLLWRRVKSTEMARDTRLAPLAQSYRYQSLLHAVRTRDLVEIWSALEAAKITVVLSKGWAVARHYPDPALRPYEDLDLIIGPRDEASARTVIDTWARTRQSAPDPTSGETTISTTSVDLHVAPPELDDRSVFERARTVALEGATLRILSAEDELRFVCLHFLRHGALRPLWLCDVALLAETLSHEIDWGDLCWGDPLRTSWCLHTLRLAESLLGANLPPPALATQPVPPETRAAVLREWGRRPRHRKPLAGLTRAPWELPRQLLDRWPNPIEAAISTRRPLGQASLRDQGRDVGRRLVRLVRKPDSAP